MCLTTTDSIVLSNFQKCIIGPNIVQNGSFELTAEQLAMTEIPQPRFADAFIAGHDFQTSEALGFTEDAWLTYFVVPPETDVSKWYNIAGSVDVVDSLISTIEPSDGQNFVDLIGTSMNGEDARGALNQNLATNSGSSYVLEFDISSNQENDLLAPREFSMFWDGNVIVDGEQASPQNTYDEYTYVLPASSQVTTVGWAALETADDQNFFGPVLDNVRVTRIDAFDDITSIKENEDFSEFTQNLLSNDSGIVQISNATVANCSDNLTMEQCGTVLQNGFPGGNVTWNYSGNEPLNFDFLADGEIATIEIDYTTETVLETGKNGEDGLSIPVVEHATWFINIEGENDRPVANDEFAGVAFGSTLVIDLIDNDIDLDGFVEPESIDIVCYPTRGTLAIGLDGTVEYVADAGFSGGDSFLYRVRDDFGAFSNIASVSINIGQFEIGDVNMDGEVNLLDVSPFVDLLTGGGFQLEADINADGEVNLLDVAGFVALLTD